MRTVRTLGLRRVLRATTPTARMSRVPEVMQTSMLDCGPASLAALLRGLGIPVSYEALRSCCATDVDGTSIDAMEQVASAVGTDAEQMVVPAEHVLALPAEYLPAIAVTMLPDGFTHFVVIWRRRGHWFEVMDPAVGRRRVRASALRDELFRHDVAVPRAAWREWAGSEVFTAALRARLHGLRVGRHEAEQLLAKALGDSEIDGLATLDAALRLAERSPRAGRTRVLRGALAAPDSFTSADRSCRPVDDADADADAEPMVMLSGAVIVRARSWDAAGADPELLRALTVPEPSARTVLAGAVDRPRRLAALVTAAGSAVGIAYVAEEAVMRPFLEARGPRGPAALAAAVVAVVAVSSLAAQWLVRRAGRAVENGVRARLGTSLPWLPDGWVRTRPTSDLAERGHFLHRLRDLPAQALEAVVAVSAGLSAAALAAVIAPAAAWPVLGLVVVSAGSGFGVRAAAEHDLRFRSLAGTLSNAAQDALLGAEAIEAGRLRAAIRWEHDRVVGAWAAAARSLIAVATSVRVVVGALTGLLGADAVVTASRHVSSGRTLLIAVLAARIAESGARLSDLLRSAPSVRSTLLRVTSSIAAAPALTSERTPEIVSAPEVVLEKVTVASGSAVLLREVDLRVPPGTHVAVVGPSGAGKSTLLSVVLGVVEPAEGTVLVGGRLCEGPVQGAAWVSPDTRVWNDTLDANLAYGLELPGGEVGPAAALAELSEVAGRLRAAGDSRLAEGGRLLSDGEAQRVRLGRAFGRSGAGLVVLDEPFQGLERSRRARLLGVARKHWSTATLFCATHDVDDTVGFDLVLVVEGGEVVASGSPAELAARPGPYRTLLTAAAAARPSAAWRRIELEPAS